MTLRSKTLVLVGASLLLSLALYGAAAVAFLVRFSALEEEAARQKVSIAVDALNEQVSALNATAGDYARWDDTYAFVQSFDPTYVESNLTAATFTNLGVSLMVFVNRSGETVFSTAMDLTGGEEMPLPEGLGSQLGPGSRLLGHANVASSVQGILVLPGGPLLVASRPVVTSAGAGPIEGTLIVGRLLDQTALERVSRISHLSLRISPLEGAALPRAMRAGMAARPPLRRIAAEPVDEKRMAGYALLADLYGEPALVLQADIPREMHQQARRSGMHFLLAVATAGLLFGGLALLGLERILLSRLGRLNARVAEIGTSGDAAGRVEEGGEDELSQLSGAINTMLGALEVSHGELQASEERYRAFVEQSSEGVWRLELEQPLPIEAAEAEQIGHFYRYGYMAECNDMMAQMHGRERAEDLRGVRLSEFFPADDRRHITNLRAFIRAGYRISDAVSEQMDARGEWRCYLNQLVGIVEGGALVRAWGIQRDVTSRRRAEAVLRMQNSAIQAASDQIIISDPEGRIQFVNPAFERETGLTFREAVGKSDYFLQAGKHDPGTHEETWSTLRRGETWQGEIVSRRKDGTVYTADTTITPVRNEEGVVEHLVAIRRDITEKKIYEERLDHLAHHDSLTGLPNRLLLQDRLAQRISYARRSRQSLAVLFLDLDHFKFINDTLGHTAGDVLLTMAAERLTRSLREVDTIARTGGDEFTMIVCGTQSPEDAGKVAQRVLDALARPFRLEREELFVTASIGISLYPSDGLDGEALIKNADSAMYRAKEHGRNNYQFFTKAMNAALMERMSMKNSLSRALERGEFALHYQPQVEATQQALSGAECLLRWQRPDGSVVSPGQFVPVLEEMGLIAPVTEWVLRTACRQHRAWREQGLPPIMLDVNVSAHQFQRPELLSAVRGAIEESGLDPQCLGVEVTESALMRYPELAIRALHKLKDMGLRLLIDDFGTGNSSLSHLKRFPIDALKIDRSFVAHVTSNPDDAAIVSAIVGMAHSLKLLVIAEGVETEAQLRFLRRIGCDQLQGYLISAPVPAEEFQAYVEHARAPVSAR